VIWVAVRSPRGKAEVVRSEQATEGARKILKPIRNSPVGKPEPLNTCGATSQTFEGNPRLRCPYRRQVVALSTSSGVRPFAISDRDHDRFDTDTSHVLEQAARTEHLVIWMRCYHNQATGARRMQGWESRKLSRPEPGSLVGPRVHIVND
jgi:hypothetical protein